MADRDLQYEETPAPPYLSRYIRCLWRLRGSVPDGRAPDPIVPDARAELILNFADPFIQLGPGGRTFRQPVRLVAGQITSAVTVGPSGRVDVWGARFHSWAAPAFLGVSGSELRDRLVSLDDVSPTIDAAFAGVADAPCDLARGEAFRHALSRRIRSLEEPDSRLPALIATLVAGRAPCSVGRLSEYAGLTARRIQALFADEVGLSPKMLMRIARIHRTVDLALREGATSWSAVAIGAGYYDQAHMIRDFRSIAGTTPKALLAKSRPLTQAFLHLPPSAFHPSDP